LVETIKTAANQAQEATVEKRRFFVEIANLKEEFAKETEGCKQDAAQAFLRGFEAAIEQASTFHPNIDFSQLSLVRTMVNGQLVKK